MNQTVRREIKLRYQVNRYWNVNKVKLVFHIMCLLIDTTDSGVRVKQIKLQSKGKSDDWTRWLVRTDVGENTPISPLHTAQS